MYVVEPIKRITRRRSRGTLAWPLSAGMKTRRRTREAGDGEEDERHVAVHGVVRALVRGLARRGAGIAELAEGETRLVYRKRTL